MSVVAHQEQVAVETPEPQEHGETGPLLFRVFLGPLLWTIVFLQFDPFARWFTNRLLQLRAKTHLGVAVEVFVADAPKVRLLLVLIAFVVGLVRTFVTPGAHSMYARRPHRYGGLGTGRYPWRAYPVLLLLGHPAVSGFPAIGHPLRHDDVLIDLVPRDQRDRDVLSEAARYAVVPWLAEEPTGACRLRRSTDDSFAAAREDSE